MGSWSGTLMVDGTELSVSEATTWGSRDRSWGVRPVGEKEPEGIRAGTHAMGGGMWGIGFFLVNCRVGKLLKRFRATPMPRSSSTDAA